MRRCLLVVALVVFAGCASGPQGPPHDELAPLPSPSFVPPVPSPVSVPLPPASELVNGGFELGDGTNAVGWDWSGNIGAGTGRVCQPSHTGGCAFALAHANASDLRQTVSLRPGPSIVSATLYVRSAPIVDAPGRLRGTITILDAAGVALAATEADLEHSASTDEWRLVQIGPIRAPMAAASALLAIRAGESSAASPSFVDDVALVQTTSPDVPLANGGFEKGDGTAIDQWSPQNGAERDCSRAVEGDCSVRLPNAAPGLVMQSFAPFGPSMTIALDASGEPGSTIEGNVTVYTSDGRVAAAQSFPVAHGIDGWTEVRSPEIAMPVEAYKGVLSFHATGGSGSTWIDNVRVIWKDEPPPIAKPASPGPPRVGNSTNALPDGTFEDGIGAWSLQHDAKRDCANAAQGRCSLLFASGSTAARVVDASAHAAAGLAFVALGDAGALDMELIARDAHGATLSLANLSARTRTDAWSFDTVGPMPLPNGTATVAIEFGARGEVRVDDVALYFPTPQDPAFGNGGFEDDSRWQLDGATRDCAKAFEGSCSLRFTSAFGGSASQTFRVEGGWLSIEAERWASAGTPIYMNVTFLDDSGGIDGSSGGVIRGDEGQWAHGLSSQSVPPDASRARFTIDVPPSGEAASFVDAVRVSWATSEP